jgi:anti-sigma B factor antagonist
VGLTLAEATSSARSVPGLVVSASAEGSATVIAPRGDADVATVAVLVDILAQVIADHHGPVIIDLTGTTFIDTATVRALERARQFLGDHGRQLTFRSPSRSAARVLALFGLSDLVEPDRRGQQ